MVHALNQSKTYADCDLVILDCLQLASLFSLCLFSHVKRDCNRLAHSRLFWIVRMVCWRGDYLQWLSSLALKVIRTLYPSLSNKTHSSCVKKKVT